ncbi:MAG: hypothetical protein KO540_16470 [Pseudomonas indica]|nr:hypothetical protein [Pseudomonas indica]
MAPTAINNGFIRKGITFSSHEEKMQWIQNHLINNDAAYGEHAFGSDEQPGKDYRGRGLLHLTHYNTYKTCGLAIQSPIHTNPELVESDPKIIVETGLWFWKENKLKNIAEDLSLTIDEAVTKITLIINGGYQGLEERKQFMSQISTVFAKAFGGPCA